MNSVSQHASTIDLWVEQMHEESDPFASEPESWPRWTDDDVWTITPPPEEPETFEPSEEDRQWLAPQDLADVIEAEDWEAFARWAAQVEAMHKLSDQDCITATGCCG